MIETRNTIKLSDILARINSKSSFLCLFFMAFSVILHSRQYLYNRSLWFDEAMNASCFINNSYHQLFDKLCFGQGIPVGFLIIEKFMTNIFHNSDYVLRLFPFICGLLSIFLFYLLLNKYLKSPSIVLSVFLFSISDFLIYYSSEVKPYSSDVFITLLLLLAAFYFETKNSKVSFIVFAVSGALAVWISYAAVFVLSGLGITLFIFHLHKRNIYKLKQLPVIYTIWMLSFFTVYYLSIKNQISPELVNDWATVYSPFAPFPPLSISDLKWYPRTFFNLFDIPLSLPFKYLVGIISLLGFMAVFIKSKKIFFMLISPTIMALIASAMHKYPFSQRMLLFLIPFFYYFIAEGALWVYKRSALIGILLIVIIAVKPLYITSKYLITPRSHEDIKPLLENIKNQWKEGDQLYIDRYITQLPFKYYKASFGLNDLDHKGTNLSGSFKVPEGESVWILTTHRTSDEINAISKYLELSGEKLYARVAPKPYHRMLGNAAVYHYNFTSKKKR